jgi:predicted TPR repeat methyltransferase
VLLARARSLKSVEETRALYHDWAPTYDADVFGTLHITGSDRIADLLAAALPGRDARLIDLGCGTGRVGERLKAHGFSRIDGLDLSSDMLKVAAIKGAYRGLIEADLTRPLPFASATYDAAVSAGTFTRGHVGPAALAEVLRIVKPGGLIAVVVADAVWEVGGFASAFGSLVRSGRIAVLADNHEAIVADGPPEAHFVMLRVGNQDL